MYLFDSAIGAEFEEIQREIWEPSLPIISLLFPYGLPMNDYTMREEKVVFFICD
jgi:hypothetical protein